MSGKKEPLQEGVGVVRAVKMIDFGMAEAGTLTEGNGASFGNGVTETLQNMRIWITDNNVVTEKQMASIINMCRGLCKWTKSDFNPKTFSDEEI